MRVPTVLSVRILAALLVLTLGAAACGDDGDDSADGDEATNGAETSISSTIPVPGLDDPPAAESCSASDLGSGTVTEQPELPGEVEEMRARILDAALACDIDLLAELGVEGDGTFSYSFGTGGPDDAADHWRELEDAGEPVLRLLVETLQLPHVVEGGLVIWPSAHQAAPSDEDWEAVVPLYDKGEVQSWREGGSGFLGYRIGISDAGDWQYFIAGD